MNFKKIEAAYRNDNIFGKRLKEAREIRGLTQESLAKKAGFHVSAINHFERGRRLPNLISFIKLYSALKCGMGWLLGLGLSDNQQILK